MRNSLVFISVNFVCLSFGSINSNCAPVSLFSALFKAFFFVFSFDLSSPSKKIGARESKVYSY